MPTAKELLVITEGPPSNRIATNFAKPIIPGPDTPCDQLPKGCTRSTVIPEDPLKGLKEAVTHPSIIKVSKN